MKNLIFILLLVFLFSCAEDSNSLSGTTWVSGNEEIHLYEDDKCSFYIDNSIIWNGVYHLYPDNSIIIYKAKAGSEQWPVAFTGNVNNDKMYLNDGTNNYIFKLQ